jgi:hypothetical protein
MDLPAAARRAEITVSSANSVNSGRLKKMAGRVREYNAPE